MNPVVIAYVPALHQGYLNFFRNHPGRLYILGSEFTRQAPRLDRDIRALDPEEAAEAVRSLKIFSDVKVLSPENLDEVQNAETVVMPEDEVSRAFAEAHLEEKTVEYIPVFLRWDRTISTQENEISPGRIVSRGEFDREIMSQAKKESEKSLDWWRQIGAVLVKDGKPIITDHNTPLPSEYSLNAFGDPRSNFDAEEKEYKHIGKFIHAEAKVIAEAAKQGISTKDASLYVTTFPCPACARSIAVAGIRKLYYESGYSVLDAEDILESAGVEIIQIKEETE